MVLASTDKFVFFYEREHRWTFVMPTANIAQMRICSTPPPWIKFWERFKAVDKPCKLGALIRHEVASVRTRQEAVDYKNIAASPSR